MPPVDGDEAEGTHYGLPGPTIELCAGSKGFGTNDQGITAGDAINF